jgi:putative transposase
MLALARKFKRYGYRTITRMLRREGWKVNRKKIYRLWRQEGLQVPVKQRKRRRLGWAGNGVVRRQAEYANHVWAYDFVMDQTEDGRRLKFLTVVDECTREGLAIEVGRHFKSGDVIEVLAGLFAVYGTPKYIRSDNGPEFIAKAVRKWLEKSGVRTLYIEPGSPWQNGYIESFNSRFRDLLLNRETFTSELEARILSQEFRYHYNHERPHSALDRTPAEYGAEQRALLGSARDRVA